MQYAGLGWRVHPLKPRAKVPILSDWPNKATTDAATIREWWSKYPQRNVGIVCGGGLAVLDTDSAAGEEEIKGRHKPPTPTARTARGYHRYYKAPPGLRGTDLGLKDVDLKGEGGQVAAPPSVHPDGPVYEWCEGLSPWDVDLAPLPEWVLELAHKRNSEPVRVDLGKPVTPGNRHPTLASLAGNLLRDLKTSPEDALVLLQAINQRWCDPPKPEGELRDIVEYVATQEQGKKNGQSNADVVAEYLARLTTLDQVAPEAVAWLWPSYIPRSKLTIFGGDPGAGKTFAAIDLVARLTRGHAWPDGTPSPGPVDVVFLTYEDGLADTLRPRLEAAGADLARVHVLEQPPGLLNLDALRAILSRVGPALLVLDPINGFLTDVESNKASEVRPALQTLAQIAREFDCAVFGIHHLNKPSGGSGNALYRLLGSIEYTAVARSILGLQVDQENDERTLVPIKTTLCAKPPGWTLELVAGKVRWIAPTDETAEEAFDAERGVLKEAAEFLRTITAAGRVEATAAKRQAHDVGFKCWEVVRRAKKQAGVVSVNDSGTWYLQRGPISPSSGGSGGREDRESLYKAPLPGASSGGSGGSGAPTPTNPTTPTTGSSGALFGQEGDNRPPRPPLPINGTDDDPANWPECSGCGKLVPTVNVAGHCGDCEPWEVAP